MTSWQKGGAMQTIIKNVLADTEVKRVRDIIKQPGCRILTRYRGPRRNRREHQDCNPKYATHATLYVGERYERTGQRFWETSLAVYAITGWKGDKPILRPLPDSSAQIKPYYQRRK